MKRKGDVNIVGKELIYCSKASNKLA